MTNELLDPETMGVAKQRDATYGYYRQPNKWITLSAATQLEEMHRRKHGWEPLTGYGRVEMANVYAADHPLEQLLMFGGAKELCREQIIEMGLHLNPPLVPVCRTAISQYHKRHEASCWQGAAVVSFPQITEEDMQSFQCRFCDRDPFPIEKARTQHEDVVHKEEKGNIRTGETLAESLVEGLAGSNVTPRAEMKQPYACGYCGEGFDKPAPFLKHVKEHKENADD